MQEFKYLVAGEYGAEFYQSLEQAKKICEAENMMNEAKGETWRYKVFKVELKEVEEK